MAGLSFLKSYVQGWLHNMIILGMRKEYYSYLLKLPVSFYIEMPTGKIAQRLFEDVDIVSGTIVGGIINFCVEATKLIMVFIILFFLGIKFIVLFAVMSVLYYINFSYFKKPIEDTSRNIGVKVGDLYSKVYDVIPGIREVKNFTMEKTESRFFVEEQCKLFRLRIKNFMVFNTMQSLAEFVAVVATCLALFFSVYEFKNGKISVGGIVMLMSYLQMMRGPIEALIGIITSFKQATPAIERIEEITSQVVEDRLEGIHLGRTPERDFIPRIVFRDVDFSYPTSQHTLKNINLDVEPGTTIALVGHTGAGKTTLVSLLLRYYLPVAGEITVSGVKINNYRIADLRKHIAVVPQHPHIFYTTIANNITYGKWGVPREDVIAICKEINLHDFIMTLPSGYDSMVGERGVKLSGGQRQLLSIARAMLKNLPILILDEATSHLDSKTESVIQDAIKKLIKNRTTIAIAHRLSTIINSDKIVVMANGQIEEAGRHEELLKKAGIYSRLYREQFKSEYVKEVVG